VNRTERAEAIGRYHDAFAGGQVLVLSHYDGLNVAQMTELRRKIREAGGGLKVVKNTLLRLALKDTTHEELADELKGPIAVAYHNEDTASLLRAIVGFAKFNDKLRFAAVSMGGKVYPGTDTEALSKLPGMGEMRGQLLSVLIGAHRKFLTLLSQSQRDFIGLLNAKKNKLDEEG
jgi:large subunit ribosomal protein L10